MDTFAPSTCLQCNVRGDKVFCNLPAAALQDLESVKSVGLYPKATTLFAEGRAPRGVFILCSGRVRLSICSEKGKSLTLKMVGAGEVLGLSSTMSGKPYEVTAETVVPSQVVFVPRKEFLRFLREHKEAALEVVHLLTQDLYVAYDRVRSIGRPRSRRARGF